MLGRGRLEGVLGGVAPGVFISTSSSVDQSLCVLIQASNASLGANSLGIE